jgi:phosphopantothenoylcysteine decarboxylase/phosphopantothenate--cysteine ligase
MHTEMWMHAATQENVATLRNRGVQVMPPAVGRLTGADSGPGRLPEPNEIIDFALANLVEQDLAGQRICISAGGTREFIDPVRFLGNSSSGKQGIALAQAALARGASVTLVAANIDEPIPSGVNLVRVVSAEDVRVAMNEASYNHDALIMAAAVADFRPKAPHGTKLKKTDASSVPEIEFEQTVDVLAQLVVNRQPGQLIVGFAAETGDGVSRPIDLARAKLARKGCDLLVLNEVGPSKAFGQPDNAVTILASDGSADVEVALASKLDIANAILDQVAKRCAR